MTQADEITVSAPLGRVELEALKRPRLGGKEPTRLSHQPRPPLGFRNGPALRYVQISRMTIIKTPTSYFACANFVTTAATLSSIWFQPSNCPLFFALSMGSFPMKVSFVWPFP